MSDTTIIHLDLYLNSILDRIYTSQNLCKYLYYDVENPLSYPDLADTSILFTDEDNKKIFTTPFSIDNADIQKSTLTITVSDASVVPDNVYYRDFKVEFYIISNVRIWDLIASVGHTALRPNAIIHELSLLFCRTQTIGMGSNQFSYIERFYPNQWFAGYTYCLNGIDFVSKG
jgi:hypothetical protein